MSILVLKLIDFLAKLVIAGFFAALLIIAALLSLSRYYLPMIEDHHQSILSRLNQHSDVFAIDADIIRANFDQLIPKIELDNVVITAKQQDEVLRINRLTVSVDLIHSLVSRQLYFDSLSIDKMSLLLVQNKAKRWGLRTVANEAKNESLKLKALINRLWSIKNLQINNFRLSLKSANGDISILPMARLQVASQGKNKRISAALYEKNIVDVPLGVDFDDNALIRLNLQTFAAPFDKNFKFQGNLQFKRFDVVDTVPLLNDQFGLASAMVGSDISMIFDEGILDLQGDVKLSQLQYQFSIEQAEKINVEAIDSQFALTANMAALSLKLSLHETKAIINQKPFQLEQAQLQLNPQQINAFVGPLNVAKLATLLATLNPHSESPPLQNSLTQLAPEGLIDAFYLSAPRQQLADWSAVAEVSNIQLSAFKGVPAMRNISGRLAFNQQGGYIDLDAQQFALHLEQLFTEGLRFEHARARLAWSFYRGLGDEWRLRLISKDMQVAGEMGRAHGEIDLDLPFARYQSSSVFEPPMLSLQIAAEDTDISYLTRVLPVNLSTDLRSWLLGRIKSASINRADYVYHGATVKQAPYARDNLLYLSLADTDIYFLDDWPEVTNIAGQLWLDNKVISADITEAQFSGASIDGAQLFISPAANKELLSELKLSANSQASAEQLQQLLTIEPIVAATKGALSGWQASSSQSMPIELDLKVPLLAQQGSERSHKTEINLAAELKQLQLNHSGYGLRFTDVNSNLRYSLQQGLSAEALSFNFLNRPFLGSIQSFLRNQQVFNTRVNFSGDLNTDQFANDFSMHYLSALFDQDIASKGYLYFGENGAGIKASASLQGVSLRLPKPFAKELQDKADAALHWQFNNNAVPLRIDYNQQLIFELHRTSGEFDGARLLFTEQKANADDNRPPAPFVKNKFLITGHIASLNILDWLDYIASLNNGNAFDADAADKAIVSKELPAWGLAIDDLHIGEMRANQYTLTDSRIDIFDRLNYWDISLQQEDIAAQLLWFNDPAIAAELHVRELDLALFSQAKHSISARDSGAESMAGKSVDETSSSDQVDDSIRTATSSLMGENIDFQQFAAWRDMRVQIDQLSLAEEDYGEWEFNVNFSAHQIMLNNIRAQVRYTQIVDDESGASNLIWRHQKTDDQWSHLTAFKGRFIGGNIADVLQAWGYSQNISSEDFSFDLDIAWPDSPFAYDFNQLRGGLKLKLNRGDFIDLDGSSTSALKVVSAFSLSNILRRIQLDFSDLTSSGLSYDKVRANLQLDQGIVKFEKSPIEIKGASSTIKLLGMADTQQEKIDAELSVTLPLASNLPWVAALAAGLPTAIGVYIISKFMQSQVDKLSSAVYRVDGDFAEPEVKFLRLFDVTN